MTVIRNINMLAEYATVFDRDIPRNDDAGILAHVDIIAED